MNPFKADTRSLALYRIGLGLILIFNYLRLMPSTEAFYADAGFLPRKLLHLDWSNWSFHALSGGTPFQSLLINFGILFAACIAAGYRTRLACFLSWALFVSLCNRNPYVLQSSDYLLAATLLWSCFMPLDEQFSARARKKPFEPRLDGSPGTQAFICQVLFLYFFSAWHKIASTLWMSGDGVLVALKGSFGTPLALWLLHYPGLLPVFNYGTIALEALAPLLLISMVRPVYCRFAGIALFASLHAGFAFFLHLGSFPFISMLMLVPFLPSVIWKKPAGAERKAAPFGSLLVWPLLALTLWTNLASVPGLHFPLPSVAHHASRAVRLNQAWAMFTRPSRSYGCVTLIAQAEIGSTSVDLLRDSRQIDWKSPGPWSKTYDEQHWFKYLLRLARPEERKHLNYLLDYLCRKHGIGSVDLYVVRRAIYPQESGPKRALLASSAPPKAS